MKITTQDLIKAFADVMEIDVSQVSPDKTFQEQGADSLIGLRFARSMEDMLGEEVDLEWIFDHPTIEKLATFLSNRQAAVALDNA